MSLVSQPRASLRGPDLVELSSLDKTEDQARPGVRAMAAVSQNAIYKVGVSSCARANSDV